MADEYRQGATSTLHARFYAYAGGPAANVTGLTVTISPTGGGAAVLGPTSTGVVNESTGLYTYAWAIPADLAVGDYVVEWSADGGVTAAETVTVTAGWQHTYVSLADFKESLKINDDVRDTLLNQSLASASRSIDAYTGRRFWADTSATARRWRTSGRVARTRDGEVLLVDDVATDTGLIVEVGDDGTNWTAVTGYSTTPDNALVRGTAITGLHHDAVCWSAYRRVRVTARWGWPAVPEQVVQATFMQANRLFKRKDSPEGVLGSAEWGPIRVSRVDPDVQALLAHLVLPGIG